jgi:hypothetical protein
MIGFRHPVEFQLAASEALLRHGERAAKAGEFISAGMMLAALNEADLFGAAFSAKILDETIQAERAHHDQFADTGKMVGRKSRKAA